MAKLIFQKELKHDEYVSDYMVDVFVFKGKFDATRH